MVSDTLEQRIYELVRSHDGIYLFKKKELTPSTDLDSDLRLEDDEALALMDDFFTTFNVDRGNFSITTYYPPEPPLKHLLNPFRKIVQFSLGLARNSKHMTQSFIINNCDGVHLRQWNRGAERHSAAVPYARQDNARLRYIYRWPVDCARCPQSVDSDFTNSRCIRRLVASST